WKHVWNQTVANVVRESAKDPAGFIVAAGGQGQTFQADHSVAAPISEPVVPCDDGAHLVAGRTRAGSIGDASGGSDDELVSGEHQFRCRTALRGWVRQRNETFAALVFPIEGFFRAERKHGAPSFRRGHQSNVTPLGQRSLKV